MAKTVKINLELPEGVADSLKETAQSQAEQTVVLALWEGGAFSTRQAAAELGVTYSAFLDLLAARGIPVERGTLRLTAIEEAEQKLAADRT